MRNRISPKLFLPILSAYTIIQVCKTTGDVTTNNINITTAIAYNKQQLLLLLLLLLSTR